MTFGYSHSFHPKVSSKRIKKEPLHPKVWVQWQLLRKKSVVGLLQEIQKFWMKNRPNMDQVLMTGREKIYEEGNFIRFISLLTIRFCNGKLIRGG